MSDSTIMLADWHDTKTTVHLFTQIVGKVRLGLHPPKNHWWHVTYQLTARGLTTGPIPYDGKIFQIDFDFLAHELIVNTSDDERASFDMSTCSVKSFYEQVMRILDEMGIECKINPTPFDPSKVGSDIPFDEDETHHSYDKAAVERHFKILCEIYPIFQAMNGKFLGKVSPLQFFWHSFDYVLTFFSGKKAPPMEGADKVAASAYSHEVISFGFWPGDENLPEPAFYAYAFPEPDNIAEHPLEPKQAFWVDVGTGHLAIYKYNDWTDPLRGYAAEDDDKEKSLLAFLESVYQVGPKMMGWS